MKCNKKNIDEYIGYFSIALVCVLSLVLSFGLVELYRQPIVANAQVIDGVDYPTINTNDIDLVASYDNVLGGSFTSLGYPYDSFFLACNDELAFLPFINYYITFENSHFSAYGNFFTTDNFGALGDNQIISSFTINVDNFDWLSNRSISAFIVFNPLDLEYYLYLDDVLGEVDTSILADIKIYSFPSSESSDTPITDDIISVIADGMSFGYSSLADGVAYTVDSLFFDNGELSNFTIILVSILGIGVALGIAKFVFRFIFTLGGTCKL